MCEPTTAAAIFTAAMGVMGGEKGGSPPKVEAPAAPPAPQADKTPEQNVFKKKIGGVSPGDPTVLAGPGGVPNDKLLLGKSTLLGS